MKVQKSDITLINPRTFDMKLKRVSGKRSTRASRKFENAELLRNSETRKNLEQ